MKITEILYTFSKIFLLSNYNPPEAQQPAHIKTNLTPSTFTPTHLLIAAAVATRERPRRRALQDEASLCRTAIVPRVAAGAHEVVGPHRRTRGC
jgi:hypothetical protein